MEAVAGNLSIRLDHVEENPAEMEDFWIARQKEQQRS